MLQCIFINPEERQHLSTADTVDFPLAMPPVNPTTRILLCSWRQMGFHVAICLNCAPVYAMLRAPHLIRELPKNQWCLRVCEMDKCVTIQSNTQHAAKHISVNTGVVLQTQSLYAQPRTHTVHTLLSPSWPNVVGRTMPHDKCWVILRLATSSAIHVVGQ